MLMFGLVVIHLMSSYCVWVCWSAIPHHLVSARVVSHGPCSVDEPFPSTFRKKASKRCLKINFLWCTPSSKLQVNENTWTCHFPNLWPMLFRTKKTASETDLRDRCRYSILGACCGRRPCMLEIFGLANDGWDRETSVFLCPYSSSKKSYKWKLGHWNCLSIRVIFHFHGNGRKGEPNGLLRNDTFT